MSIGALANHRMRKKRILIGIVLTASLGVPIGYFVWNRAGDVAYPTDWFSLEMPMSIDSIPKGYSVAVEKGAASVSYSDEALFSEIPTLEVETIAGRVKFLPHTFTNNRGCSIGYVIDVAAKPLLKDKLPDKYKKPAVVSTGIGPLTILALDEATFEVHFIFRLLDADGFELLKVVSSKHEVCSGETSCIQSQTEPSVRPELAALTETVMLHMAVDKCLSVRDAPR